MKSINKSRKADRKPVWDLERDGITSSLLSKFFICRERFRLATVEGWTSRSLNLPIEFGNVFHNCLEDFSAKGTTSVQAVRKITNGYLTSRTKGGKLKPADLTDLQYLVASIEAVFPLYVAYWTKNPTFVHGKTRYFDKDLKYTEQEKTFEIAHTLPSGRVVKLRGKRDSAFIHPVSARAWIQENKTKGNIDAEGLQTTLSKDLQTMFYSNSFFQENGVEPEGVLYNVIRRPGLKPGKTETVPQFVNRVHKDIEKRPEWYFMRWRTEFAPGDLKNWVTWTLNPILETVCQWWDSIKHNPFEPWTTPSNPLLQCSVCGEECEEPDCYAIQIGAKHSEFGPDQTDCDGIWKPVMLPNPHHFERPFGIYDASQFSARGDFYEPIARGNFHQYYRREVPFPELEETDG